MALDELGRPCSRRSAPERGGGRTGRRRGRRPPSVDCWLWEHLGVGLRLPEGLDELGGSFYRRSRSVPAAAVDKNGEPPFYSCRATWRRRARADELADELELFQGAAGVRVWLGRRRPWQRPAADAGVPPRGSDGGAVGRQGGLECSGEWSRAGCGSARLRGARRWRWKDRGGSARDVWHRSVAAAELAGDEEDGLPPSLAGYGSARGMVRGYLRV